MRRATQHRTTNRRGATIAEALVAMLVLTIGILALVGATSHLVRAEHAARADARAAELLADRLETADASPCADTAGVAASGPFLERWRVAPRDDVAMLADTVRHVSPSAGPRLAHLVAALWCTP